MKIEINSDDETSILKLKPAYKPLGIAGFITIMLIGFLVILIQSIVQIINGDFNKFFIPIFALFFWGAYYNFFNFYWAILGDEIVEINNDFVKHTKSVWIFKNTKKYKKSKIEDIRVTDTSQSFGAAGTAIFGFSNIHVEFKYGRKKKIIGKQIDKEEANLIIEEFKNKKYATQHRS